MREHKVRLIEQCGVVGLSNPEGAACTGDPEEGSSKVSGVSALRH